jgi:hypothetical protein
MDARKLRDAHARKYTDPFLRTCNCNSASMQTDTAKEYQERDTWD